MNDLKRDFPVFDTYSDLVYLDTAASSQKLGVVVDAVAEFSKNSYANVHRGLYELGEMATAKYEGAREVVAEFIGASSSECVFVRNATEGINLIAWSWAWRNLKKEDVVLLTVAEHHANMVPWMELSKVIGFEIEWIGLDDNGFVDLDSLFEVLSSRGPEIALVSVFGVSNVLGQRLDVEKIVVESHKVGAKVLIDACQMVVHERIDVSDLDCDFLVFSGHKLYGSSGIGVMYVKEEIMNDVSLFPPFMSGGDMVNHVTLDGPVFKSNFERFEAGTPNIEGAVGLAEACKYLMNLEDDVWRNEKKIVKYLEEFLLGLDFIDIIGPLESGIRHGLASFNVKGIHAHDVAQILGDNGIAVRAGQHCAHPLVDALGVPATVRVSVGIYNSKSDVDRLLEGLKIVWDTFN